MNEVCLPSGSNCCDDNNFFKTMEPVLPAAPLTITFVLVTLIPKVTNKNVARRSKETISIVNAVSV